MADPKNNFPFQADPYTAAQPPAGYQDPYGRALTRMGQSMLQHTMVPGAVFQGVTPQQPGMLSDIDVARQLMLEQQAQTFGPAQAINMIGGGTPFAQRGLGSVGSKPPFSSFKNEKEFFDWLHQDKKFEQIPADTSHYLPAQPVAQPPPAVDLDRMIAELKQMLGPDADKLTLKHTDPAAYAAGGITAAPAPPAPAPAPASPASMMTPAAADYAAFKQQMTPRIPGPEQYAEQLKPLDWRGETSPHHAGTDPETTMRASEAGFNIFKPLFKGGRREQYPEVLKDPTAKSWERGFFLADDPYVATRYGEVLPYLARAEKPHEIDWYHATGTDSYDSHAMHQIVEAGHVKGADMLVIRNIFDMGGKQDQYVVLNPAILRAPTAKFDYDKLKQAMPLAGIAGGGAIVLDQNGDLVRYINGREREHYDPQQVEGIIAAYQTKNRKTPASDFRYKGGLTETGG